MAHEFESGFFVAKGAWHGLGTTLLTPKLRDYHRTSTADYRRRSSWRNSLRSQVENLSRSLEVRLNPVLIRGAASVAVIKCHKRSAASPIPKIGGNFISFTYVLGDRFFSLLRQFLQKKRFSKRGFANAKSRGLNSPSLQSAVAQP